MDRYLTPEEVGQLLSVPEATIRSWLREGRLRGYKLAPKMWRIKASDVDAFLMNRINQKEDVLTGLEGASADGNGRSRITV